MTAFDKMLDKIIDLLERHAPGLILMFILGYKRSELEMLRLKKLTLEEETKRKRAEAGNAINKKYADITDPDIVKRIASGDKK